MLIKKFIIVIMVIFCNIYPCFAQEFSVDEIINKVHKAYGEAKAYSDSGEVKTTFIVDGAQKTDTKTFTTAFVRPDRFRFEFKYKTSSDDPEWKSYIVWQNRNEIIKWKSTTNKNESSESISMAIASATGVSGGSAFYIPSLLLPSLDDALGPLNIIRLLSQR